MFDKMNLSELLALKGMLNCSIERIWRRMDYSMNLEEWSAFYDLRQEFADLRDDVFHQAAGVQLSSNKQPNPQRITCQ